MALLVAAEAGAEPLRIASFNVDLARTRSGQLFGELADCGVEKARRAAEILQRLRPDIVLLNEFDWDEDGAALARFRTECLAQGWNGAAAIAYPHHFTDRPNTGFDSGRDLDGDGAAGGPGDSWGYGRFPGQYGMALLSRFPITGARTFRTTLWANRPEGQPPEDSPADHPLSSKSHWDVTIATPGGPLHILASHPAPPIGRRAAQRTRNRHRNADEIGFWVDYLTPERAGWITDDAGGRGGAADAPFILLGDLNADPVDGDAFKPSIRALLDHARLRDPRPRSDGAVAAAETQAGKNARHRADPAFDTADFSDKRGPGNLRVDYALPSADTALLGAGVFWPPPGAPLRRLVEGRRAAASDHRLVWVEIALP